MADLFKRLNPNVVFVTIIALVVFGAYVGRQEYRDAKRAALRTECSGMATGILGNADSPSADFVVSLGTITDLCTSVGGETAFRKAVRVKKEAEKVTPANEPAGAASPED